MATKILNNDHINLIVCDKNTSTLWVISSRSVSKMPGSYYGSKMSINKLTANNHEVKMFLSEAMRSARFREKLMSLTEEPEMNVLVAIDFVIPLLEIDSLGGGILQGMINERVICDTAMSYLSTLGGAFSALGDSFSHCAEKAGEISFKQYHIAVRLGEEPLAARCRLYLALSVMQQGRLKVAQQLIVRQYDISKQYKDTRLSNMCKGVWAKLQYTKKHVKERS